MSFKHNKKRNIGLLSEFFSRYIARAVLEGRHQDIDKAKYVWNEHVRNSNEMKKELQLFNSLYNANVSNQSVATELMNSVKEEAKKQNIHVLNEEKTNLLYEINNQLGNNKFFSTPVSDYKTYASIQVLLNNWRSNESKRSLNEIAQVQDQVFQHLLSENKNHSGTLNLNKSEQPPSELNMTNEEIDGLVVNIMHEKFNKKFNDNLTESQKDILNLYTFSENDESSIVQLKENLKQIRDRSLSLLESELRRNDYGQSFKNKLKEVYDLLHSNEYKNLDPVNDDKVSFYMSVAKLKEDLESDDSRQQSQQQVSEQQQHQQRQML